MGDPSRCAFIYRYANAIGLSTDERVDLSDFPDAKTVQSYASEAMQRVVVGDATGGVSNLRPQSNATRAQFAAVITRFQALPPAEGGEELPPNR